MNIENEVKRKRMMSLFITAVFVLIAAGLGVNSCEKKTMLEKKKEALRKSEYGASQMEAFREIFSAKEPSPEEYDRIIEKIAERAIRQARYEREKKEVSTVIYGNLIYDLYLASKKWGIKDERKLEAIRSRLKDIADEEIDLNMDRCIGLIGMNEMKKQGDVFYKDRLCVIRDYLPDEKKAAYSEMEKSLDKVFGMEEQ